MDTIGEVIGVSENTAKVKFVRAKACKNCGACVSFSDSELVIDLDNRLNAKVGDKVIICLHAKNVVRASLIMYGVPLVSLLAGAYVGSLISDLYTAIFGIAAACAAYLVLHLFEPYFERKSEFQPKMLKILNDTDE